MRCLSIVGAFLLLAVSGSQAQQISCEQVRAFVASVGLAQAKQFAKANGMTRKQRREARQCLRSAAG